MYDKSTKFLLFLFLTVVFETPCLGAFTSNYGQITNVQAYSSNPYYNQNGMYNQGFPRPVYAQGTDLGSGDCENIITAVIADYCSTRNKCNGLRLSDVRPGIMVALSQMPNHNYITSCYGFLDGAFDKYIESNPQSVQRVNQNINVPQLPKESFPQVPKWKQEYDERSRELENLQKQNDDNNGDLTQTDFPKGIADVSFQERIKNTAEDMQNYKDMKAYYGIDVNITQKKEKKTVEEKLVESKTKVEETPVATVEVKNHYNGTTFADMAVESVEMAKFLIEGYGAAQNWEKLRFESVDESNATITYSYIINNQIVKETFKFGTFNGLFQNGTSYNVLRFICEKIYRGKFYNTPAQDNMPYVVYTCDQFDNKFAKQDKFKKLGEDMIGGVLGVYFLNSNIEYNYVDNYWSIVVEK
ncbi:MAG: hypothetical protein ACLRFI_00685 [Alphaproteobacteria bacterium]